MSKYDVGADMPVGDSTVELMISFEYTPPSRAVYEGPMMGPAEGPRVEYLTCWLKDGSTMPLCIQKEADKWAEGYLVEEGYDAVLNSLEL